MATAGTDDSNLPQANLPVISLARCDTPEGELVEAQRLRAACEDVGFFYVQPGGPAPVPDDLIERTFQMSRNFFHLPLEQKMKLSTSASNARGYTAFGTETLNPEHQTCGDTKEGYYLGRMLGTDEAENALEKREGNQYPDETDPANAAVVGFRDVMSEYFEAMRCAGMQLLRLLALSLGLPREHFLPMFSHPMALVRLLKYPAVASAPEDGVLACGAHSDYGCFTLLRTDGVPGLEVFRSADKRATTDECRTANPAAGSWMPVAHVPGMYVVNIGDMLKHWTNGQFRSTVHRVVNYNGAERFSIPFFLDPNFDTVVECLPMCVKEGEEGARPEPPIRAGEYLMAKYGETYKRRDDGPSKR